MRNEHINLVRREDWTHRQRVEYQQTVVSKREEIVAELTEKLALAKHRLKEARRFLSNIKKARAKEMEKQNARTITI